MYIYIYTPNISQCLLTIEDHRDGAQQSGPTCGAPILRRFSSPGELQILRFPMGNPYKSTRRDGTRNTIFWKNHLQFPIFFGNPSINGDFPGKIIQINWEIYQIWRIILFQGVGNRAEWPRPRCNQGTSLWHRIAGMARKNGCAQPFFIERCRKII